MSFTSDATKRASNFHLHYICLDSSGTPVSGSDVQDTIFDQDVTRLDEARTFSSTPKELGLIKRLLESEGGSALSGDALVVMDGKVKALTPQFTEEGGNLTSPYGRRL